MIAVVVYFLAIIISNLSIAYFGAWVSPINSFLLIGLDLSLRDHLHDRWQGKNLCVRMTALIITAGIVSYALNPASGIIAVASSVAFVAANITNTGFYHSMIMMPFLKRANMSNAPAAAVDSLLFPLIAFGVWMPAIVVFQFAAKVIGGFMWSIVIMQIRRNYDRRTTQDD